MTNQNVPVPLFELSANQINLLDPFRLGEPSKIKINCQNYGNFLVYLVRGSSYITSAS